MGSCRRKLRAYQMRGTTSADRTIESLGLHQFQAALAKLESWVSEREKTRAKRMVDLMGQRDSGESRAHRRTRRVTYIWRIRSRARTR